MGIGDDVVIRLIGGIVVVHDGGEVDPRSVGGPRCAQLIAFLAVNRHRRVSHAALAEILWPDHRPSTWNSALRGVLSRVRDTVEAASLPDDTVRSRGGMVQLHLPAGHVTDIELLRGLCAAGDDDLHSAVRRARAATALVDQPALRGVTGRWADDLRAEVAALHRRALETDADGSLALGDHGHAVAAAEALLELDPLRESAYRTAMSGYLGLGEHARALDVATRCRQTLAAELGIAPSAETEQLYLDILRSDAPGNPTSRPAVLADELIGRAPELAAIADAVDRAARGSRQFVVVSGEAGSGKSTVTREAMRRARSAGIDVLYGRCSEEAVIPFEPFAEAVGAELEALGASASRQRLRRTGSNILRLVPDAARRFGEMVPSDAGIDGDDRSDIMTAVLEWLTTPARSAPTLLVIDDLHWASPATLAVIRYVISASATERLCVVTTVRAEFADRVDIRSLLAAAPESGMHRMALGGLSPAEVGAIVEASGATLDPDVLHLRTHGLPLFVVSLIASHQSGSSEALPASVAESVAQRERLLGPEALRVLQLCSVTGMSAPRLVLRMVASELDDHQFAGALDDLVRSRLIAGSESSTEIELRHPVVQEAVYAEIDPHQRRVLHSQVACAISDLGEVGVPEEYARLAYHFSRGLESDAERARDNWWKAGASAVSIGAYEDAVAFYRSVDDRLVDAGDSEQRCRLLVDLGRAQRKARDPDFRPTLLEAADMARRLGDVDLQVTATLANDLQGILYVHFYSDDQRIADLHAALDALDSVGRGESADAARLLAQLAIELIWVADHTTRQRLLVRAIDAARSSGDGGALVAVLSAVVVALRSPQCAAFRRQSYDELMELLASPRHRRIDPLVAVWIARQQIEYGDLRAATRTAEVFTDAQVSRDPELAWLACYIRFAIDLAAGRLELCENRLVEMLDIPSPPMESYTFGRLLGPVVALRTLRGDLAEVAAARDALTERFDVVETYRACLATALVDVGEIEAGAELVAWYDRPRLEGIPINNIWLATIATIGRVAAQVRNTGVCADVYEILSAFPEENTISWASVYGTIHHHLGELSIALGDYDRAADHLDDALHEHSIRNYDGWHAETAYLVALLHSRRFGEPSTELVTRARRLADTVGATAVRRRIDALVG